MNIKLSLIAQITCVLITSTNHQTKPQCGKICRKCWLKVQMFHVFYQHIEEIQTTVIKIQPIIVENIALPTKIESNFEDSLEEHHTNELEQQKDSIIEDIVPKHDECFDDNDVWRDADSIDSLSQSIRIFLNTSFEIDSNYW